MSGKSTQSESRTLAQTDSALANYLDTLLAEIDPEPPSVAIKEPPGEADMLDEVSASNEVELTLAKRGESTDETGLADIPGWAETPFQVLRFRVNEVNLVVPLLSLTGIIPLDRPISHLPGQPAWSLGVVMNRDTKVVAVDTCRLLMPQGEIGQTRYSHLLLLGEGNWGLAVERLGDTAIVDKEAIRWRSAAAQQPWYGGIWIEELSVLLDVDGVKELLAA